MSTVAEQLRQAREAQNLTVHQMADITKIRTDHIRALEEGNFNVFSAPVYIRGFVRTCASLLKLDVRQTMAALDEELGRTEKFCEPPPLTPTRRGPLDYIMLQLSKVDWRKAPRLLIGAAILAALIGAAFAWRHFSSRDPLAGMKPALYQPAKSDSGNTLPPPQPSK